MSDPAVKVMLKFVVDEAGTLTLVGAVGAAVIRGAGFDVMGIHIGISPCREGYGCGSC